MIRLVEKTRLSKILSTALVPRLLNAGLLFFMFARMISSALVESAVNDEPANIPSGYLFLLTGHYMDGTHPPLLRYWASIPLLILRPDFFPSDNSWYQDWRIYGRRFLYHNNINNAALIFWPRLMVMILTIVLGWLIGHWAKARHGVWAGTLALGLFTLDPNMLAHGHYVTPDMAVTLAYFAAVYLFWRYIEKPSWPRLLAAALAFACAQITKFSAILLVPSLLIIAALLAWFRQRRGVQPKTPWYAPGQFWVASAVYVAVTVFSILAAYRFEVKSIAQDPQVYVGRYIGPVFKTIQRIAPQIGQTPEKIANMQIPAYDYFKGILLQSIHTVSQNTWVGDAAYQYALGMYSRNGWWWYFPLAFAVKTPLTVLVMLIFCAALGALALYSRLRLPHPQRPPWTTEQVKHYEELIFLFVPVVVFMGTLMTSTINIGHRYLLPVYPFLYVLISRVAAPWPRIRFTRLPGLVSLGCFLAALPGSLLIHPHYVSYFNELVGPANGYKYLAESNVDWGQDLLQLKNYLAKFKDEVVYIGVLGTIQPEDLGIIYRPIPTEKAPTDDHYLVAISVNEYLALTASHPDSKYLWLHHEVPIHRIGYSIFIYELANYY